MYFPILNSILLRGLNLTSFISPHSLNTAQNEHYSIHKRQNSDTTAGGQIIYSIPSDEDTYGGVPEFTWKQIITSFVANSTAVIFSILVRNDPSFFSFDDFYCSAAGTNGTNLIANPGFESGTWAPWFLVGVSGLPYAGYVADANDSTPHSGDWCFYDGAVGGIDGISQVLTTVPGTTYQVTFWISEQDPVNAGTAALAQNVVSDFAPPSNLHLTPDTDSGSNHTDGITNVGEPVLVGNASPRIGVNVYLNGTFYGTVNSDQNGTFTFPFPSDLTLGETTITAASVVGNSTSGPSTPPFVVTYIPPSALTLGLQYYSGSGGSAASDDDVLDLAGEAAPDTNITILDGGRVIGSTVSGSDGSYLFVTTAQSAGMHNYTAQEPADAAGNVRVSPPLGIDILGDDGTCEL